MKTWLDTARVIALDKVADSCVDALAVVSVGATTAAAQHIGQAAADIIELSNIIHEMETE